jgi:hypothetical protein
MGVGQMRKPTHRKPSVDVDRTYLPRDGVSSSPRLNGASSIGDIKSNRSSKDNLANRTAKNNAVDRIDGGAVTDNGSVLPSNVTVLGRTTAESGGEIVVRIATNGINRYNNYAIEDLLSDKASSLIVDLVTTGLVQFTKKKARRAVADEIIDRGVKSSTVVLAATGLTSFKVNQTAHWAYAWAHKTYWFGPVPKMKVLASRVGSTPPFAGSFEEWKKRVGRRLRRNPYLIVMISHALAAALRQIFREPYLVLLLIGPSSSGKTTSQRAVASLFGSPDDDVGVLQMSGTEIGILEQVEQRSDLPILFQDTRQNASVDAFFRLIFSVADGATRYKHGSTKRPLTATAIVSNERGIMDIAARSKGNLDEGLFARCFELSTEAPHGFFHDLHGCDEANMFAKQLRTAAEQCHGTVWPKWLEALESNWEEVMRLHRKWLPIMRQKLATYAGNENIGAVDNRMLDALAFSAWTGVIASKFGVLPIDTEEIRESFGLVFSEHTKRRRAGNTPLADKVISEVRGYIDAHPSRFPKLMAIDEDVRSNISGFRSNVKNVGQVYLFLPEVFHAQIASKHGAVTYRILEREGLIHSTKGRGFQLQMRMPGSGNRKSFIAIKEAIRYDRLPQT